MNIKKNNKFNDADKLLNNLLVERFLMEIHFINKHTKYLKYNAVVNRAALINHNGNFKIDETEVLFIDKKETDLFLAISLFSEMIQQFLTYHNCDLIDFNTNIICNNKKWNFKLNSIKD